MKKCFVYAGYCIGNSFRPKRISVVSIDLKPTFYNTYHDFMSLFILTPTCPSSLGGIGQDYLCTTTMLHCVSAFFYGDIHVHTFIVIVNMLLALF